MRLLRTFFEAMESLSANKLRAGLTILGIVIGVAAVIAMLSLGAGAEASITESIESIGTNLLYVTAGGEASIPQLLTTMDAEAIANSPAAPSVLYVAPIMQGQVEASVSGYSTNTSAIAITPEYFKVQNADVAEGVTISQEHIDEFSSVVLLGVDVALELFNRTTGLVGETVRVNNQPFKVIGVLKEQGGTGFGSSDDRVLVPLSTGQMRLMQRADPNQVNIILVQARSAELVPDAIEEVSQILRSRHVRNLGVDDFDIRSTQAFLETASTVTGIMTAFLGGIAGISLLVGGIGIMNIMLVTVVERTREIGLRKALGARKADIRTQFLLESSLLSLGGGAIGILAGWGIAQVAGRLVSSPETTFTPVVELEAVLLATLFSAAVGLFFGWYPAHRAANLEPVEALRYE